MPTTKHPLRLFAGQEQRIVDPANNRLDGSAWTSEEDLIVEQLVGQATATIISIIHVSDNVWNSRSLGYGRCHPAASRRLTA
jgi:hypothetical protein